MSFYISVFSCNTVKACSGCGEVAPGDEMEVFLREINPAWPKKLIGKLHCITPAKDGRIYVIECNKEDLNVPNVTEAGLPAGCDVLAIGAYCCCNKLGDHTIATQDSNFAVIHNFDGTEVKIPKTGPDLSKKADKTDLDKEIAERKEADEELEDELAEKADKTITITGDGLATGGGDLSANRKITVTEATDAEIEAGTSGAAVVTPRRLKNRFSSWWDSIRSTAQNIIGQWTFSGEPRSTADLSGNGNQLVTADQVISLLRARDGVLVGSDADVNLRNYPLARAMSALCGRAAGVAGASDELLDGWISVHNPGLLFSSNEGPIILAGAAIGQTSALSIMPASGATNGMFRNDYGRLCNVACRIHGGRNTVTCLDGRRFYFGFGKMTNGVGAALTKGPLGVSWGGFSDFVQIWNGTDYQDTALRWKDATQNITHGWDFQIVSKAGEFTLFARTAGDKEEWTELGKFVHNGYNLAQHMVIANIAEGPNLSPADSNATLTVVRFHYATNRNLI